MSEIESPRAFAERLWNADLEAREHLYSWVERELKRRDELIRGKALLEGADEETQRLCDKNRELNRRCQTYESALSEKLEETKRAGISMGRALANAAATMCRLRLADAERRITELEGVLRDTLKHTLPCGVCLRPATYLRAMCHLCDVCAADPTLDWIEPEGKEGCLMRQAPAVRRAAAALAGRPT